jgi:hypothetical protein
MNHDILVHNAVRQLSGGGGGATQQPFTYNSRALDAIGALPVSTRTTLGNYVQDKNQLPFQIDRENLNGTQTYTNGIVNMEVVANSGDYAIAQTYQRHPYFAGKSHRIEITFDKFQNQAGVTKRVGYFSSNTSTPYDSNKDGFWLESDGTTHKVVIANDGSLIEIDQASWNVDKLDGTGASGVTQDFSLFNVMVIDFLYLGGTAVRFGLKDGEGFNWFHVHEHSNNFAGLIMRSPHQPLRWEIRSTGGAGTIGQVCGDVATEGTLDIVSLPTATPIPLNPVQANTDGVNYALAGIRLASTDEGRRTNILNTGVGSLVSTTNESLEIGVVLNPSIAGTVTWTSMTNEPNVEYLDVDTSNNPSTNIVTGGYVLYRDFLSRNNTSILTNILSLVRRIGHSIDGTADELILYVRPLAPAAGSDVYGVIQFNTY